MQNHSDKNHYRFQDYCDIDRWSSYWHQLNEILRREPGAVLEIGVGDKTVGSYLKSNTAIHYASADINSELQPDVVCGADKLKFDDNNFDLVCAFEVLEHLPFEKFEASLKEMRRVANKFVLISLPHWGRHFSLEFRLPGLGRIRWQTKFSFEKPVHAQNGRHFWEIGKRRYSLSRIRKIIRSAGLEIIKDYVAFESPYHHFFVLKK